MKNLLYIIFTLASLAAHAQQGSQSYSLVRYRVNDSTSVNGSHGTGYSDIYYNRQKKAWRFWDHTSATDSSYQEFASKTYVHAVVAAGGGGSGGGVNIYNADSTLSGNRTITTSNFYLRLLGTGTDIPKFVLDAPNNIRKAIHFRTGNLDRWQIHVEDNETGSGNAGTNLHFERFDDAGAFIDAPFGIRRTDGIAFIVNGIEVPTETYGSGWNGDATAPRKDDIYDKIETLQSISNTSTSLTDGAAITITGTKHTLTSDEAAITWTLSQTGDYQTTDIILNATTTTWTFPANTLCVVEGAATGNNIAELSGVSGDHFIMSTYKDGTNYRVVIKNFGQ